jgi:hypothetical protein
MDLVSEHGDACPVSYGFGSLVTIPELFAPEYLAAFAPFVDGTRVIESSNEGRRITPT